MALHKMRLAISPCPNDTFIFHGLAENQLKDCPWTFETEFHDVQTLNEMASTSAGPELIKVSCGGLPDFLDQYYVLSAGGAMGYGNGPLLLSSQKESLIQDTVWLPGKQTTAAMLFEFWRKTYLQKEILIENDFFDEIYKKLQSKEIAQGVAIHECRFTWKRDGLFLIEDLGAFWEQETGSPVPLGCILCKRDLGKERALELQNWIQKSLQNAWNHPEQSKSYIQEHAGIPEESVTQKHIETYVNDFSMNMGEKGKKAIQMLLGEKLAQFESIWCD